MEAMLYETLEHDVVLCKVCNHYCRIESGKRGICSVRENLNGTLIALDYRKAISVSIDPIEKKPLYEFMPRTRTYSFATEGCNLHCPWCQNHEISQILPTQKIKGYDITPENHVQAALRYGTPSISYTYSEPTIFLEYALETMKLAKQEGLKNIWVSNGYMSKETMDEILPYTDAFNIDYKGTENVYHRYCGGHSQAVLDNLKRIKDNDIHLEVTTLLIPGINDSADQVEQIANELIQSIGKDFVWHLTRFHPQYKMTDRPITSRETMYVALKLARDKGIHSVYLGNI